MVAGVGIDIVEVEKIAQRIGSGNGFRELVFSPAEIDYCESRTNKFEHYAARFAAKEAFFKSVGTGWAEGTQFNEIEVARDAGGKPFLNLLGGSGKWLESLNIINISVSLSHIQTSAVAVVIIEK